MQNIPLLFIHCIFILLATQKHIYSENSW
ncbi:hypothetical protein EAPG_00643 [Escherichia albertii B156]|nr:hypothetical protein EAPG_00643 [Escherichia albertii B156]